MTLDLYTSLDDHSYYVIADVSIISDNLGVPGSSYKDCDITMLEVFDEVTGASISLNANRALRDHIEGLVRAHVAGMGLL